MNFFRKTNSVQTIQSELATLEKRRSALQGRFDAAGKALEAARAERRRRIIDDDDQAIDDIAVARAERDMAALRDALNELDSRLADAHQRIEIAREMEAREAKARRIDAAVTALDRKAVHFEKSVEALAKAYGDLRDSIPADFTETRRYAWPQGADDRRMTPEQIAAAVLAESLYAAVPDAFEIMGRQTDGVASIRLPVLHRVSNGATDDLLSASIPFDTTDNVTTFLPASGAVEETIVRPLRALARSLRAGSAPPREIVEPPPFELVDIVFTKPVSWIDEFGNEKLAEDWAATVPRPLASAAFALGVAVAPGTKEAREHRERAARLSDVDPRAMPHLPSPERVDLGVSLKALIDAEREQLNRLPEAAQ